MRKLFFIFILSFYASVAFCFQQGKTIVSGTVTDSEGAALHGAIVVVDSLSTGTRTDASGHYSLALPSAGTYLIKFSYIGYETVVEKATVKAETILDIRLAPKAYLTGEVLVNATRAGDKTPLAYTSVSSEVLRRNNIGQDLPFLLALTPSLVETSEAGNGIGYTSLRVRGTDGSRINVTIDGIPLNDPESQQVFWVDLPDIAASTDNIQIQRGAGTSTNGAGAFGATISLQTRGPESEAFAEAGSTAGSFGTFKNSISVGTGMLSGRYSLEMRYSDLRSDGYIDRTGSKHRSAYISGFFRSNKSTLKANLILGDEHTGIGWWGVPADSLATNRRYNPAGEYRDDNGQVMYYENESDNYKQNHVQLIWNRKAGNNTWLNSAFHYTMGKGYYEEYREDQSPGDYGLENVSVGGIEVSETDLIRRKWMDNDFLGLVYSVRHARGRLDAVAGGGANIYLGDHFGKIIWMEYAGTTPVDYQWYFNDSRKGEVSVYGKGTYSFSPSFSAYGDLQYRYVNYKMSGIDDDLRDIGQAHTFSFFNPKAGIFFSPADNKKAWLSFSVANREPARADFKEASGDNEATPKPETLYDTELGYSISKGSGALSVNAYYMYYSDQLVPTGELSNVGYPITTNVPRSYRLGIETTAGIGMTDRLRMDINLTLSRNRIKNFTEYYTNYNTSDWTSEYLRKDLGDVDIAYSPSVTASGDLCFSPWKALNLHVIGKYVGRQYFDNTMSSSRMMDPFFVTNLRIDYSPEPGFVKGLDMQLLVNNIFNAGYESNAYGGNWYEDGNEKTWAYYFPQAGINFMARIGIRF